MRFSDVVRGARAVRSVALQLPEGRVLRCGVRPLHPEVEEPLVTAEATQRTTEDGAQPVVGDPIFESWLQVLTLARACVDLDTAEGRQEPFFDEGAEQILRHLDRETIRRLYRTQVAFQAECLILDAAGDIADQLLEHPEGDEVLSPQVVAAEFAVELAAYYGQPAHALTSAQVLLWLALRAKYRKRFGPAT
jgi:hypothetical protein